MLRNLKKAIKQ